MNHAEQAEKLLARYHEGQGSDQVAIAHALLAINDTLRGNENGSVVDSASIIREQQDQIHEMGAHLTDLNQRINAALKLADWWESNRNTGSMSFLYATQLREVLR